MAIKVKLKNLGYKPKEIVRAEVAPPTYPVKTEYPTLCMSDKHMDGLDDLQRDDVITLVFEAKVRGTRSEDSAYNKGVYVDFDLLRGTIQPKKSPKSTQEAVREAAEESKEA